MKIPAFPMFVPPTRRKAAKAKRPSKKKATTRRANPSRSASATTRKKYSPADFWYYSARTKASFQAGEKNRRVLTITQAKAKFPRDLSAMMRKIRDRAHEGGTPSGSRPGLPALYPKTRVVVARFKTTAKGDRPKGQRGQYLAWGIEQILAPKGWGDKLDERERKKKAVKRKPATKKSVAQHNNYMTVGDYSVLLSGAARRPGGTTPTVRRYISQGSLKAQDVRRAPGQGRPVLRVSRASLDKLVAKRKAPAKRRATTTKAARRPATRGVRRSNPGRLMVLNPLPKHIEKLRNTLSPAERKEFDQALRRFIRFHGGAFPSKVAKVGDAPGTQRRFLVGMGKAKEVGYEANKGYPGSNKEGTAWLHQFKGNPHMATTANGKQILVLNQAGARRRFKVTDWVRG